LCYITLGCKGYAREKCYRLSGPFVNYKEKSVVKL
jgi:hypothetical protein